MCEALRELMAEDLKDAEKKGIGKGIEQGIEQGIELGRLRNFVENIESLMRMQNWTLRQACEALGSTEELYHQAKEKLKGEPGQ